MITPTTTHAPTLEELQRRRQAMAERVLATVRANMASISKGFSVYDADKAARFRARFARLKDLEARVFSAINELDGEIERAKAHDKEAAKQRKDAEAAEEARKNAEALAAEEARKDAEALAAEQDREAREAAKAHAPPAPTPSLVKPPKK